MHESELFLDNDIACKILMETTPVGVGLFASHLHYSFHLVLHSVFALLLHIFGCKLSMFV
jgi:hypothetical protein